MFNPNSLSFRPVTKLFLLNDQPTQFILLCLIALILPHEEKNPEASSHKALCNNYSKLKDKNEIPVTNKAEK